MANEILSEIRLELDKFRADLKEAQSNAADAGKKSGKSLGDGVEDGLGKAFGGIKTQLLALAGTIAGAFFTLKASIGAAMEQENAINQLNSALALSGQFTQAASDRFNEYASSLQKTTVFADDVITKGGAMLVTMGKLSGEGLTRHESVTRSCIPLWVLMRIRLSIWWARRPRVTRRLLANSALT